VPWWWRANQRGLDNDTTKGSQDMLASLEKHLKTLMTGDDDGAPPQGDMKMACAALMVHCARADGTWSHAEDKKLTEILTQRFELTKDEADKLIDEADKAEKDSPDLYGFAAVLRDGLDRDGRIRLVRQLWEVANADGNIDAQERHLVGLAAKILHVEVQDAVAMRQDVENESKQG